MTDKKVALDTNVLVYLHDSGSPYKAEIAQGLLSANPRISSQVISEYLNTMRRLLNLSKEQLLIQTSRLFISCPLLPILPPTLLFAADFAKRYQFQLFDAIIVAAAFEGNCEILYSEDMHTGLVIENKLTIVNPFL